MSLLFRFRRSRGPAQLALGMAGVRMGERLLQVGAGDPVLFAAAAGKVGLTGQASAVVESPESVSALELAAANEGVLVDVVSALPGFWPYDGASFDVAIVDGNMLLGMDVTRLSALSRDLLRVVRDGGRVLAIHRSARGWAGHLGFDTTQPTDGLASQLTQILDRAGFGPVRFLAAREGLTFVEAFRPRTKPVV